MKYKIVPAVEDDGTPTWALIETAIAGFAVSEKRIATNRDKAVLEAAIEHLEQGGGKCNHNLQDSNRTLKAWDVVNWNGWKCTVCGDKWGYRL